MNATIIAINERVILDAGSKTILYPTHRLAMNEWEHVERQWQPNRTNTIFVATVISARLFFRHSISARESSSFIILAWRFVAAEPSLLCYLIHDYYQYKLQMNFFCIPFVSGFFSLPFFWLHQISSVSHFVNQNNKFSFKWNSKKKFRQQCRLLFFALVSAFAFVKGYSMKGNYFNRSFQHSIRNFRIKLLLVNW